MSGGSAKSGRRRAAPASLRYEHRRVRLPGPKKRDGGWFLGCLGIFLTALAIIVPVALFTVTWGAEIWGDLADDWPGGGYGLAATVGALVPFAFAAFVAPLTRMNWGRSKARSLAWACACLPGLLACQALGGVIAGVLRPKRRRDWDAECYSEGHSCWVHVHYPWVWLVGLLVTLAVGALLIAVLVKYVAPRAEKAPAS
jgi:MFS family permease